jgi:putative two-component system response regulator
MRSATQPIQTSLVSAAELTSLADVLGAVDPCGHLANGDGHVLVVDDEITIRQLLSQFLSSQGFQCETADSGESALEAIRRNGFDLIISDIRMPRFTGLQLLDHINRHHPALPVIMITAVADLETAVDAMKQGAADYITKPFDLKKVVASARNALQARRTRLRDERLKARLAELVESKSYALDSALKSLDSQRDMTLEALVRALDARESETRCHSLRVQSYAIRLARQFDIGTDPLEEIARGALLHDIGKIGISDSILLKPGKLTEEEWREMRKHPALGYEILRGIEFLDGSTELVLRHHERWNGSGYPEGVKEKAIPFGARIFAVVDSLDAMTSDRPYRKALTYDHARNEIEQLAGVLYDPEVVAEFLKIPRPEWAQISRLCDEVMGL